MKKILFVWSLLILTYACSEHTPKPIGYNRIEQPIYSYKEFEDSHFSFLYSEVAKIDTIYNTDNKSDRWFNIVYTNYNARIYCSFSSINKQTLNKSLEDSYRFAYSHATKANSIHQVVYSNQDNRTFGVIYDIGGNVATPVQFYLTDSVSSFFRASLYYDIQVNEDSISPITQFIKEDIKKMVESFKWK